MLKRWRYRKAMWKAIKQIRTHVFNDDVLSSTSDALRAIRRFEQVNGIKFDPFDKWHVIHLSGCGVHERFFRRSKKIFENI